MNRTEAMNRGGAMTLSVRGQTNIGLVRARNEDAFAIGGWVADGAAAASRDLDCGLDKPVPLLVSDGMGGHRGGDVAARTVIHRLADVCWDGDRDTALTAALRRIESELAATAGREPSLGGMGATLAGVVIEGRELFHFNVGDSRVYLCSDRRLRQLSTDDRVARSPMLTQALGGHRAQGVVPNDPHAGTERLAAGDAALLCTDGLTDLVSDAEIEAILAGSGVAAADRLVALALERGGRDNVTVIVARITPPTACDSKGPHRVNRP